MMYRIRIDDVNDVATKVTEWVGIHSQRYFVMHHLVNANSHFHLYMDSPMTMSAPAMRYKVKTKFNLSNVQYSVKLCDESRVNEYLQYLFNTKHGNVATIVTHNFDNNTVDKCRSDANRVSEEFSATRKTKTAKSLYEIAIECRDTVADVRDLGQIIKKSIFLLHKYCKCHDRFLVMKLVQTVQSLVDPDEYGNFILRLMA